MRLHKPSPTHVLYLAPQSIYGSTQDATGKTQYLLKDESDLSNWLSSLGKSACLWVIAEGTLFHTQSLTAPNLERNPLRQWLRTHFDSHHPLSLKSYSWHLVKSSQTAIEINTLFWGLDKKWLTKKCKDISVPSKAIQGVLPDILLYNYIIQKHLPSERPFLYIHLQGSYLHIILNNVSTLHYRKILINKLCLSETTHLQSFIIKTIKQTCTYYKFTPRVILYQLGEQEGTLPPITLSGQVIHTEKWQTHINATENDDTPSLLLLHAHEYIESLEKAFLFSEGLSTRTLKVSSTYTTSALAASIALLLFGIGFTHYNNHKTQAHIQAYQTAIHKTKQLDHTLSTNIAIIDQLTEDIAYYNHAYKNKRMWSIWFQQFQDTIQTTPYTWVESLEFKSKDNAPQLLFKGKMLLKDAHTHTLLSKEAIEANIQRLTQSIQAMPYVQLAETAIIKKESPYILQFEFHCKGEDMPLAYGP